MADPATNTARSRPPVDRPDLMLFLTGAPHASDMVTSALRLLDAVLRRGGSVQVWACGYSTMLTQRSLGDTKPRNLRDWHQHCPTTAALIRQLLVDYEPRLGWSACRFCSEERGATNHLAEVRVVSPLRLRDVVTAAAKVLYLGGA